MKYGKTLMASLLLAASTVFAGVVGNEAQAQSACSEYGDSDEFKGRLSRGMNMTDKFEGMSDDVSGRGSVLVSTFINASGKFVILSALPSLACVGQSGDGWRPSDISPVREKLPPLTDEIIDLFPSWCEPISMEQLNVHQEKPIYIGQLEGGDFITLFNTPADATRKDGTPSYDTWSLVRTTVKDGETHSCLEVGGQELKFSPLGTNV